jgi:phosphoenolpyruvate carboxylase
VHHRPSAMALCQSDDLHDLHFGEDISLAPLEEDCRLLGNLLDDTIRFECGEELMKKMNLCRTLASSASAMSASDADQAAEWLFERLQSELAALEYVPKALLIGSDAYWHAV